MGLMDYGYQNNDPNVPRRRNALMDQMEMPAGDDMGGGGFGGSNGGVGQGGSSGTLPPSASASQSSGNVLSGGGLGAGLPSAGQAAPPPSPGTGVQGLPPLAGGGTQPGLQSGSQSSSGLGGPATTVPGGTKTPQEVSDIVNKWMSTNNPYRHADANYWIQKILNANGGATDQNIQYFLQRFMEDPNNNSHTGEGAGGSRGTSPMSFGLPPELAAFYSAQTQAIQAQQAKEQQVQSMMRDALINLMQQGQQPVDVNNDPTLSAAARAYRDAQRREQSRGRDAIAERAAFTGLNSGGQGSGSFESALQSQEEGVRQDIAGYEANLAVSEMQQRRQQLMQALQIAQSLGAQSEANNLQRQLAMLDAQIRQQSLQQQQGQFEDTSAFNWANLQQQANRDAVLAAMGG